MVLICKPDDLLFLRVLLFADVGAKKAEKMTVHYFP